MICCTPSGSTSFLTREALLRERARVGVRVVAQPVAEPITLTEAKMQIKIDELGSPRPDDDLIMLYVGAAREWCENILGRSLAPQTFEVAVREFPGEAGLRLPMSPVTEITSVTYIDEDGDEQTLDPEVYLLDSFASPPLFLLATDQEWPTISDVPNAVKIQFTSGYSLPGESPQVYPLPLVLKAAMMLMLGHLFLNRESTTSQQLIEIPNGVRSFLWPYQLRFSIA